MDDSKVVLGFISNASSRFHVYVANRVQLIHDYTNPSQWHYVDSTSNTADEGSRGMLPKDFVEKSKWIKGPDFLKEPAHSWLKEEAYEHDVDPKSPEVKNVKVNTSVVEENDILKRLQRFSSWQKAKIAVALCLRYKRKLRDRVLSRGGAPCGEVSGERSASHASSGTGISVADLEEAEVEIVKQVQRDVFPSEIRSLQYIQANVKYGSRALDKEKKAALKKSSSLSTLDPFLDKDGVMRVGGRIRKANLSATLRNLIILPEHRIWCKNSGQGGVKNICSSYKQETSGFGHKEISRLEMLSC